MPVLELPLVGWIVDVGLPEVEVPGPGSDVELESAAVDVPVTGAEEVLGLPELGPPELEVPDVAPDAAAPDVPLFPSQAAADADTTRKPTSKRARITVPSSCRSNVARPKEPAAAGPVDLRLKCRERLDSAQRHPQNKTVFHRIGRFSNVFFMHKAPTGAPTVIVTLRIAQ